MVIHLSIAKFKSIYHAAMSIFYLCCNAAKHQSMSLVIVASGSLSRTFLSINNATKLNTLLIQYYNANSTTQMQVYFFRRDDHCIAVAI